MRAHARAEFARLAYLRAVAAARAEPTAARWERLLRAARNLKAALADRERERASGGWRARAERPRSLEPRRSAPPGPGTLAARPPASPPRVVPRARLRAHGWAELEREIARGRELMAQSRRLVAEAHARCAALRAVVREMEQRAGSVPASLS